MTEEELLVLEGDAERNDWDLVVKLIAEVRRLTARNQELLEAYAKLSREAPYPDEVRGWTAQRGKMLAEVGTLRAENQRLTAELTEIRKGNLCYSCDEFEAGICRSCATEIRKQAEAEIRKGAELATRLADYFCGYGGEIPLRQIQSKYRAWKERQNG